MVVDAHAHLGKGDPDCQDILQKDITPEMIIEPAKEAGIDATVVFPVTYRNYDAANEEIADAVRQYPDALIGYARVNPTVREASKQLRRAVEELGLVGLKLHHGCDRFDRNDPRCHEIVNLAGEMGIPVIFHSMQCADDLLRLAKACPKTNIIFGHFGGMWDWHTMDRYIEAAESMPNVYLETSACLLSRKLREACLRVPDKVMFGSDAPGVHPGVELAKIRYLHLPEEIEAKASGGNILRLLGRG